MKKKLIFILHFTHLFFDLKVQSDKVDYVSLIFIANLITLRKKLKIFWFFPYLILNLQRKKVFGMRGEEVPYHVGERSNWQTLYCNRQMKNIYKVIFLLLFVPCIAQAQVFETGQDGKTVMAGGFWEDWYMQFGLDMSLQNPYGYNFANVFPNGKSFGLDLALGKWFTHQVGVRGKLNWENALPLLKNDHANWLAPFYQPGVNRDKGGYLGLYADALFNLHNFFGTYRADRTWNISVYPRVGLNYNFGVKKGSLLLGVGVMNTYRLNERWSLVADVAYIMSGSGFVGSEAKAGTGTGSNSNGYFSIGLGAQYELGKLKRDRAQNHFNEPMEGQSCSAIGDSTLGQSLSEGEGQPISGIWKDWFVQFGLDMSLMNPYGCNFGKVIPKGMTFGLNAAIGKWFSKDFGLRARIQWENGLIPNNSVEWLPPRDDPQQNYKKGGLATFAIDAMFNLTNVIAGYQPERKWHTTGFVRAGLITQFVEGSGSPLMGVGLEETYRLTDRISLFGSLGYQVSTSEGMGYGHTGMDVPAGSNGFFDLDMGVVIQLGK